MKTFTLAFGLFICALMSAFSSGLFAETRERHCEADQVFPERKCVVEFRDGVPHGTCRADDDTGRLILTEEYVRGQVQGKRICYDPSGKKVQQK